jgi:hypothetical protein
MRYISEAYPEISIHSMRLIREKVEPSMGEIGGNGRQYDTLECCGELKLEDKDFYKKDIALIKKLMKEGVATIEF